MLNHNLRSSISMVALVAALAGTTLYTNSFAQAAEQDVEPEFDEIVVTGIRASERAAIDTKRSAKRVLDAIAAEDIGELPERSIAETLELLPGVTGNQDRGRSNTVSVRGLGGSYTKITLNNRDVVSSFGSRSVNLNLYPSEAIRKGVVYKTGTPDLIEGGISGTVNLSTIRPMEIKKNLRVINVFGIYNPSASEAKDFSGFGQNISGILSQKFNENFAIAIGGAYLSDPLVNDRVNIGDVTRGGNALIDFDGDGAKDEFSAGFVSISSGQRKEERASVFGSIQWNPSDRLELTVDGLYSKFEFVQKQALMTLGALNGGGNNFNSATNGNGTVNSSGFVTGATVNSVLGFTPSNSINDDETVALGFNARYSGDQWMVEADISYSEANRQFGFQSARVDYPANTGRTPVTFDYSQDPEISFVFPDGTDLADLDRLSDVKFLNDNKSVTESDIFAAKLDLARDFDTGFFTNARVGVRYSKQNKMQVRDNQRYADAAVRDLTAADVQSEFLFDDPFPAIKGDLPASWFYFDPADVLALSGHTDADRDIDDADLLGGFDIEEKTFAAYAQAEFETEFLGRPLNGIFGVRYFDTDVMSRGVGAPFSIVDNGDETFSVSVTGALEDINANHSYSEWLPSLNLNWDITEKSVIRIGAGRTIIRANFTDLGVATNINNGSFEDGQERTLGSRGNPFLDPIRSDQIDVSFEWYPRKSEIVSVSFFYKELDGIYQVEADFVQLEGQSVALPLTTTVKTQEGGSITGVEFTFRKELDFLPGPLSNLSLSGNYTIMDITLLQDYNLKRSDQPEPNQTLFLPEGMVESTSNVSLSYDDNHRWSGRVNWKHQSEFVSEDGGSIFLRRPNDIVGAVVNYKINDNFTVVLQGNNLFNSVIENGQVDSSNIDTPMIDVPSRIEATGRRFRFGIRARW